MVAYEEVLPGGPGPGAPKEDWIRYLRDAHGDIEDGKVTLLFIAEAEGFEVEAEDIEAVTDEPPGATFT
jgi:hypothetical protein